MAKTFSIPLMYEDAGDGNALKMDTGKTVTLRESPYETTLYTLAETATAGVYAGEVEDKIVRLYVNGVYKAAYGTFRTYADLTTILQSYLKLTADQWDLNNKALINPLDPTAGTHVGDRDFNDARYLLLTAYVNFLPAKCLLVSDQLTAVATKIYNTPQAAIDYANSQVPNDANYWKIFIYPHSNTSTGYTGGITAQNNIKLIGMGIAKISGAVAGLTTHTSFQNIMFQHSGNLSFGNSAFFKNCYARLTGASVVSITLDTLKAIGLGLMCTHANHTIVSAGNNIITGWHNKEFAVLDSDKIFMDFLPGFTDLDMASSAE